MNLIKKAQAAVNIVTDLTASLTEQKATLEAKIAEKNDAIKKLLDMPMNLDDFCSFIPEFVRIRGESFYSRLGYENRENNLMPWGAIENESGETNPGPYFLSGQGGDCYGDAGVVAFRRECFFHPENTVKRLTDKFKSEFADSWGNEQLPAIAERRATIKTLQAERDAIQADLDEVNANINGILSAANGMNNPGTAIKAPQAERDAVEAELNGVDGSAGETPETENTPDTTNTGGDN
ncbi:hypothetical protein BIX20_05945 [Salmonella enterica]|nr:hypothetical protein [Salmonella enterica]ECU8290798.1 hypothetical protein [Salmonella enterica subsp. enterica serovar Mississippi]EBA5736088.1 hypothetical protein [Salmonella enterica]ECR8415878.1 hypothetical protein [Salmonella enterica]EKK6481283.1 hypothetical protein [Salmonella enterica]